VIFDNDDDLDKVDTRGEVEGASSDIDIKHIK
jgi:hypothetical protein